MTARRASRVAAGLAEARERDPLARRSPPEQIELTAAEHGPAVAALAELVGAERGWMNLFPEVAEDDAQAVAPSAIGALFRASGPPIPQATLIAPADGRRGRRPAQLGLTHGVGTMVVRRLAAEGIALREGWTVVQDHVRRGLVVRLDDPLDPSAAVEWAMRAATAVCPVPVTGRWLAEVHRP